MCHTNTNNFKFAPLMDNVPYPTILQTSKIYWNQMSLRASATSEAICQVLAVFFSFLAENLIIAWNTAKNKQKSNL